MIADDSIVGETTRPPIIMVQKWDPSNRIVTVQIWLASTSKFHDSGIKE